MIKNSVAIIGLGYVGLPLAILLKKFKIYGFDANKNHKQNKIWKIIYF